MVSTIIEDLYSTDFDLYNRIVDGFETEIVKSGQPVSGNVVYCHGENLLESLSTGKMVVCLGEKWFGKWIEENIINGENLRVTNNIDEARYIIRALLAEKIALKS